MGVEQPLNNKIFLNIFYVWCFFTKKNTLNTSEQKNSKKSFLRTSLLLKQNLSIMGILNEKAWCTFRARRHFLIKPKKLTLTLNLILALTLRLTSALTQSYRQLLRLRDRNFRFWELKVTGDHFCCSIYHLSSWHCCPNPNVQFTTSQAGIAARTLTHIIRF